MRSDCEGRRGPVGPLVAGLFLLGCSITLRAQPGALDPNFVPYTNFVASMAVQADGKVLLGGHTLTRLHPGGEPDSSFKVELRDRVQAIALDAQGRIYIGGGFAEVNGQVRNRLARLFRTGALDPRADPGAGPPLT